MKEKISKLFKIICSIVGGLVGTFLFFVLTGSVLLGALAVVALCIGLFFIFRFLFKGEGVIELINTDNGVKKEYKF